MPITPSSIIALDVGDRRVGVAIANLIARLPRPLKTLERGDSFKADLEQIVNDEQPAAIVVGLPRDINGQHTAQTDATQAFAKELESFELPIYWQDEALTSQLAEAELDASGKPFQKGDVDALAASYILQDFLADEQNLKELTA